MTDRFPADITKYIAALEKRLAVLERPRASAKTISHIHASGTYSSETNIPHGLGYSPAAMGWVLVSGKVQVLPFEDYSGSTLVRLALCDTDSINIRFLTYYVTPPGSNVNFTFKYILLGETALL